MPEPTETDNRNTVGLIGVGLLGSAIAERLIAAGFLVVGCDTDFDRLQLLRELGGWTADSPAHVAGAADRIVLSLPDSDAVESAVEGPDSIMSAARHPTHIIDTTTGDPDRTTALAARLAQQGVALIDATVSGSSQQLRERQAVIMAGGEPAALDACKDILACLSDRLFLMGPPGSGAKAKLASNLILGLNRLALAEGLVLAEQLGLDLTRFLEVLEVSPAGSAAVKSKGPRMLAEDFTPESRIRQHRKDLALILARAAASSQPLPLTSAHAEILDKAIAAGDGDLDNAAVIRQLKRLRG